MSRKAFFTTIDEEIQEAFRQVCKKNKEKMNDVLEAFMQSYIDGEFKIKKQIKFTVEKTDK